MNPTLRDRIAAALAAAAGAYSCYAFFMTHENGPVVWRVLAGVLLVAWLVSLRQLLLRKRWAYPLSLVLTLAALGLGVYYARFAWNFWLFEEPTLRDRFFAVLYPPIFILSAWPLLWCVYLLSPGVRSRLRTR